MFQLIRKIVSVLLKFGFNITVYIDELQNKLKLFY